ncbi:MULTISPECIES: 3-hydroxyacyl-CoA dehydrogenase NAD-binding domain-containing protein [unclassified Paenibacillus]|uniref:3-hydroxyacyl-CoA dehydrogenase NAD-binding domain-containing protein n=1 Tax=unclassified Paenibacillus TaxID=185978 RepID=UPI001AE539FD|nr:MULTISPECIES: 3-hydroxyacyl-CoA dehydrogenase NAD-binding domain-containing protein [unclassified Paenibacillus]MBP1156985.1 3-hydroxybutyryl-CoA dehydrogenase [Paenibacillus sp. PvP091]MBP1172276.1 3-hydroxybutyryl-CoA dehydrogenase [Paenibacillus sp. PvR098]MBP2438657.1 3-hydroxybutyryl-CoA dehydrogenase [Paenibacillus sp. PvP052]
MKVQTVGVIGSGTMGAGIAQVISQNGFSVLLYDINEEMVQRSLSRIHSQIDKLFEKGKLTESESQGIKIRLRTTVQLADLQVCQIVIEAAPEKMEVKRNIFQELDPYCSKETILATNTSSFSITEIAGFTNQPERVAGLHFFNPATLMPLVEVISGLRTSEATMESLANFARSINKSPVTCKDTPGFIVNRIARPYYNEALRIMGDQMASAAQIDRIMTKAGKFRMGPFELQDMIGVDINFSTTESLHQGFFGDARFRPHYYQQRMVQSGQLGRKSGGGYYEYDK